MGHLTCFTLTSLILSQIQLSHKFYVKILRISQSLFFLKLRAKSTKLSFLLIKRIICKKFVVQEDCGFVGILDSQAPKNVVSC